MTASAADPFDSHARSGQARRDEGPAAWQVAEWDREPDEVWEPWRPEPGQRVRVRLNRECEFQYRGGRETRHFPELDGQVGCVAMSHHCSPDHHDPSHRFEVWFSPTVPLVTERASVRMHCFAACELIPISDTDATAPGSGEGDRG